MPDESMTRAQFDRLYAADSDPWRVADSWYEERKRTLVLAALPERRFRYAYEPACGTGALTAALALRCDRLLASDFSDCALEIVRRKLAGADHVELRRQHLPQDWPQAQPHAAHALFDLIVISEFAYYLAPGDMTRITREALNGLTVGGHLLACHWLHPFVERRQSSEKIHREFGASAQMLQASHYRDKDFLLDIWRKTDGINE